MELVVYRRLRVRRQSALPSLLASLGIYIVLENAAAMIWGDAPRSFPASSSRVSIRILGGYLTRIQVMVIGVSAALAILLWLLLRMTHFGLGLRAVASDRELAAVSGVPSGRLLAGSFFIGSALAGVAGGLAALEIGATPTMGMRALMMGIAAMVVGGGRVGGLVAGAFVLSIAQNVGVWFLGGSWQEAVALIVLFAFLLARPNGLFGKEATRVEI